MRLMIRIVMLAVAAALALVVLALGAAAAIIGLPLLLDRLVARYTAPPTPK
jgi:hypothetical protein